MKDSRKSSRVPPAPAADLRQAKNLLPKDRHARVGFKPKSLHSNAVRSKNHLAWYVALNTKHSEKKIPHTPQIKWNCPHKFALNTSWLVAAGEESQETEAQNCRVSAALKAVYTDLNAIPPCPFTSSIVEGEFHDDGQTPIIPLIPIEEAAAEIPFDTSATVNTSINPQPPASCPSVSADLPVSQGDPSESQDQSVIGKPLPCMLHGLESGDLEIVVAAAATVLAVMQSNDQIDPKLLIKFLSDPEMIKKLMNENGFTSKPEHKAPSEPKATACSPLPSLTPASVVDKLDNGGNKPASKAIQSNSIPEPVKKSPIPTEINKVAANKLGGMRAGSGQIHTSKAAKGPSHSPRFNSDGPTKKLTAFTRTNQISRQQNPLYSSPSMLNLEVAKKMIHNYGAPDVARVKPMAPLVDPGLMPPPNLEVLHRNMENCLLPDHAWRKPFMGSSPSLLSLTAPPPMANLLESHVDATGIFHPSFAHMTIPARGVDLRYHKSLINQHGEIHNSVEAKVPMICQSGNYLQGVEWAHKKTTIEMDPKYQKPCIYFTSSTGCRNGYNCLFQHNVPEPWRATGAVEALINPVAMAPVAKQMRLNDHFGNWR